MLVSLEVWSAVAAELRAHRAAGLGALLTEDTVRFAVARALVADGADPSGMRVEWPHPALRASRIDLVVGGVSPSLLVELKYPREPVEKNAAWTMALGEVLKDLYRLAVVPGEVERLFVFAETSRLRAFLAGSARRYGLDLDVDQVVLDPRAAATLPATAASIIGAELTAHRVTADRLTTVDVDDELRLSVYRVHAISGSVPSEVAATLAENDVEAPASRLADPTSEARRQVLQPRSGAAADGARAEILAAARAITTRSTRDTFTVAEVVDEMRRARSRYAESTIRTMLTSHLCANAPNHAAMTYADVERVDRGRYRLL